jgi:hypothetical protein
MQDSKDAVVKMLHIDAVAKNLIYGAPITSLHIYMLILYIYIGISHLYCRTLFLYILYIKSDKTTCYCCLLGGSSKEAAVKRL